MTRFLQSLLTLTFLFIGAKLCIVAFLFVKINRIKDYDPGPGLGRDVKFEAYVGEWPFTIGRSLVFDSAKDRSSMKPFLGFRDIKPGIREDGRYYLSPMMTRVPARFDEERFTTFIPVTEEVFSRAKALFIFLFLASTALYVYAAILLYKFVRTAGQKSFFDARNAKRLRLIGLFILLVGVVTLFRVSISLRLLEYFHDDRHFLIYREQDMMINIYYVIAGLLLLVIAEAFRKGNQLQTEQEFTI